MQSPLVLEGNVSFCFQGGAGLDYTEITVAQGANQTNGTSPSAVYLTTSQPWTKAVERLFYYTQLVTMQAATTAPCSNDSRWA